MGSRACRVGLRQMKHKVRLAPRSSLRNRRSSLYETRRSCAWGRPPVAAASLCHDLSMVAIPRAFRVSAGPVLEDAEQFLSRRGVLALTSLFWAYVTLTDMVYH